MHKNTSNKRETMSSNRRSTLKKELSSYSLAMYEAKKKQEAVLDCEDHGVKTRHQKQIVQKWNTRQTRRTERKDYKQLNNWGTVDYFFQPS